MEIASAVTKANHQNNFGFLRVLFASFVVFAHSSELIDGNRSRELWNMIFGNNSLGVVAVDGFFLISGYLITQSFLTTASVASYFVKRILRIYPGFIVSYLICIVLVAPLAGASPWQITPANIARLFWHLIILKAPNATGAFSGLPYPALNGSMWTIAYEFRCYVLIAILGVIGVLRRPFVAAALVLTLLILNLLNIDLQTAGHVTAFLGAPRDLIQLSMAFLCGSSFYLFSDRIPLNGKGAAICALLGVPLLFNSHTADAALSVFGGYILFWFALKVPLKRLARVGNPPDISYGLYLYAWPIANLIVWWLHRDISPLVLALVTLALAMIAGRLSWDLVERPAQRLRNLWRAPAAAPTAPPA